MEDGTSRPIILSLWFLSVQQLPMQMRPMRGCPFRESFCYLRMPNRMLSADENVRANPYYLWAPSLQSSFESVVSGL